MSKTEAREQDRWLSRLLDLSRQDGPNHFILKDGGAVCRICEAQNPLGNLRKMSIQEVTEPAEIIVCFGPGGPAGQPRTVVVNVLHIDRKTVLGPG
jgi:hypothetical protein